MQEDFVTLLILENMKFQQFLDQLEQLEVALEYQPDWLGLVARLYGIPFGQIPDYWLDTYESYIEQASACPYHDHEALLPLARACRDALNGVK